MQDFGHAPIHDFGQAAAQDPAPQPFPGPAQIPAPVTGYHRDIILPALIEISGAIRNHDRRLDTCVTRAEFEATTEELVKSQQAQERRIDALPNAEAFAALVNENADLKEQLRSFKKVQDELVEGFRRVGQGAGGPERDDALPLRRVSASEGSRSGRANNHQVRPDLAGMSRHDTHVASWTPFRSSMWLVDCLEKTPDLAELDTSWLLGKEAQGSRSIFQVTCKKITIAG